MKRVMVFLVIILILGCAPAKEVKNDSNGLNKIIKPPTLLQKEPFSLPKAWYEGDLIISKGTHTINNTEFNILGDIIVKGTGKLVVRDAIINFEQNQPFEHELIAEDFAIIEMNNVAIKSKNRMNSFYQGQSQISLKKTISENIKHTAMDSSKLVLNNPELDLLIKDNSRVSSLGGQMNIELYLSGVEQDIELDNHVSIKSKGKKYTITLTDAVVNWKILMDYDNDIILENSEAVIALVAGSNPKSNSSVQLKLSDLQAKKYDDFSLKFDTNRIRLSNSKVLAWEPISAPSAIVEIHNSDLGDLSGEGKLIVKRSKVWSAFAKKNAVWEFTNSQIGKIIALDGSKINLINSEYSVKNSYGNAEIIES